MPDSEVRQRPGLPDAGDPLLPIVAQGDRGAVNDCIRRYGSLVWSLARRLSATPSDAEDAVQEIFLDLWRHAARFDPSRGSEKVFVAVIARRRLIDRIRGSRTRLAAEAPFDEAAAFEASPNSRAERDTEVEEARSILMQLPAPQQKAISLSLVHGMSHGEIASAMDLPLGTVKTMIRRGVIRVRAMLSLGVGQ